MRLVGERFTLVLVILIAALLTSCAGPSQSSSISVSGAFALYPLMVQWAEDYQVANASIRIDVSAGGAGKGMSDVLSKAVDIAMISRPVSDEEVAKGAFVIPVARDAVFCTLNAQNPYLDLIRAQGISKETLAKIFMSGKTLTWGEVLGRPEITDEVHVFTRSDSAGAAEMWSRYLGGKVQEDLQGIGVNGDPGILDAVIKDPLGIGYNNLGYAFDAASGQLVNGVFVLPLDGNEDGAITSDDLFSSKPQAIQAIEEGLYPSPPARNLYLVTNGKPSGAVSAFLTWILTDGQKDLATAGYIPISAQDLSAAQEKLR